MINNDTVIQCWSQGLIVQGQGQGQGHAILSPRRLEAKDMISRTPTMQRDTLDFWMHGWCVLGQL